MPDIGYPPGQEPPPHRADHPDDVVTVALLRPFPDSVLLGVAARDEAGARRAEQALRPRTARGCAWS